MNIKTKFGIGERVWGIWFPTSHKKWMVCECLDIGFIEIYPNGHWYGGDCGTYSENAIFHTKKEAEAECRKRNKKG